MITQSLEQKKTIQLQKHREIIDILQILKHEELISQGTFDKLLTKIREYDAAAITVDDFNAELIKGLKPTVMVSSSSASMSDAFGGTITINKQKYSITLVTTNF